MKHSSFLFILALVLFLGSCKNMKVQQINGNEKLPNNAGVVYYLPKTIIYLDVEVHRCDFLKGPFATYSSKYTGISNVISENSSEYRIEDIKITTSNIADTSNAFLISLPKSKKHVPHLEFSSDGILLSMNYEEDTLYKSSNLGTTNINENELDDPGEFKYFASENIKVKTDTIFEKIVLDTITIEKQILEHSVIEKSDEDKAKDVADYLKLIAEHKLNLLSGYQEVGYSLETIKFMYEELDHMEKDYLSLFTGKEVEGTLHFRFAIMPDINMPDTGSFLCSFDGYSGLLYEYDSVYTDRNIFFKIISSGKTNVLNNLDFKARKGIYYNIPDNTRFVLCKGNGEVLFESNASISQFGKIMFLPTRINAIRFNNESGSIRSIK
ncbi:MAG: DUF4831 family protein [Bacteroidales bacterium]|nr:DUF4831 family protein [Bacteroidales bacterium]